MRAAASLIIISLARDGTASRPATMIARDAGGVRIKANVVTWPRAATRPSAVTGTASMNALSAEWATSGNAAILSIVRESAATCASVGPAYWTKRETDVAVRYAPPTRQQPR